MRLANCKRCRPIPYVIYLMPYKTERIKSFCDMLGRLLSAVSVGSRQCQLRAGWPVIVRLLDIPATRSLVIPAREFNDMLEDVTETSIAYSGQLLAQLCPTRRGHVLQDVLQQVLSQRYPGMQFEDPVPGLDKNGNPLDSRRAKYDFSIGGRRVECKSAKVSWCRSKQRWLAHFRAIKLHQDRFDDLYLVLFSPNSVVVLQHDLRTCISQQGHSSSKVGASVLVLGPKRQKSWKEAMVAMIEQLLHEGSDCQQVAVLDVNGQEITSALSRASEDLTGDAYKASPLEHASPSLRGYRIEAIAFEIDKCIHPEASFLRSAAEKGRALSLHGQPSTCTDWLRNGIRVEVKHGRMRFDEKPCRWACHFSGLKTTSTPRGEEPKFDELWLVVFSPQALHFFKDDGALGSAAARNSSYKHLGNWIYICGPSNEPNAHVALEVILQKLTCKGCTLIATVPF